MRSTIPVVALSLLIACSSSAQRGEDHDSGPSDADADSDPDTSTETDSDTDSGTDTDSEQWAWHWEDLETLDLSGSFFQRIAGTSTHDVVAVGWVWNIYDKGAASYDGVQWSLEDTEGYEEICGLCVTGAGTYHAAGGWSPQSGVLRREDGAWFGMAMPEWWQPDLSQSPYTVLEQSSLSCIGAGDLVALFDEIPGETFYLASHDGTGWATLAWPGDEERWWPYVPPLVVGESIDDLHFYGTPNPGPSQMEGKLFDGDAFSTLPVPETQGGFRDVEGDAEHGWWAAGYRQPPDPGTVGPTGAVWFSPDLWSWVEIEVPHPPDPETYDEGFRGVWVSGKGDVYMVGYRAYFIDTPYSETYPALLRFDGQEWEEIEVPPHPESGDAQAELWDVWGADDQVFAVGECTNCDSGPAILHYGPA